MARDQNIQTKYTETKNIGNEKTNNYHYICTCIIYLVNNLHFVNLTREKIITN